ncbi:S-adenosyl-L-methionine-dependent methyltransferase [Hyaloscypha variabilis F]|uniref:S-adenosyl-L-methionine-dependent methyltransferase n=1 Tax=Hyaloscypha variabilis (strain UAMH 11265 / GT02V1 / F) TaxID=1149755 RepID=A0A2J6S8I6_HYAVF|nr:S-adenosyl-L-methionine-dependent methyltransferase [Hyaloscypha variabilis F]
MSQQSQPSTYTQGYSSHTTSTQQSRTAESDAAFLIPHIKKGDHILDIGCGPGTITTGFIKYVSEGSVIGIDISPDVLQKAQAHATSANIPTSGPGSVTFQEGNIFEGLPFPDDTFDIVYCSQVLGHFPPPDLPLEALTEMRRVLKTGGILATREAIDAHFYPKSLDLDRLWLGKSRKAVRKGAPEVDSTSTRLPALLRAVGFDADRGKVKVGAGTRVFAGRETRGWLAWRAEGQLTEGDPFRQSWIEVGITEEEIQETLVAVRKWAGTEDAWFVAVEGEMLAWK